MAEVVEEIKQALRNGLRADDRDLRSGQNSTLYTFLKPTPFGARAHESVTVPISSGELSSNGVTIAHPFPQLFIGREVTLLVTQTTLFTVNMANWTLTAVTLYNPASPGSTATVAGGGGPWHFMDFGTTWMLFNGASIIFKSGWIAPAKTFVDEAHTTGTGCAFRGRGIMGNFSASDYWTTAWTDFWNSIPTSVQAATDWSLVIPAPDANWVGWSSIGGGDLLMNRVTPSEFNMSLAKQLIANGNFLNGATDWALSAGDWAISSNIATHTAPTTAGVDTMTQAGANMLIALAADDYWLEFDTKFTTAALEGFIATLGNASTTAYTKSGRYRTKITVASGSDLVFTPQQTATAYATIYPRLGTDSPSGDVDSHLLWTRSSGASNAEMLDAAASGAVYVRTTTTVGAWLRVKMKAVAVVPNAKLSGFDVHLTGYYQFGNAVVTISLYNGSALSTVLASDTVTFDFSSSDKKTVSFSTAEAESVTDWSNLVIKIAAHPSIQSTITLEELSFDLDVLATDSFTVDNITVKPDLSEEEPMALHYARRNESGFMPMPFQGAVLKVMAMRERVMVYGADGIAAIIPSTATVVSQPFSTFGLQEGIHRLGIASRDAVGGDLDEHVFIDTSGVLYKVNSNGETERLGFEEFFVPLLGQQFTVNFDPDLREYYITGDDGVPNVECYHLTADNKLSKFHQLVSSIFHKDGGIIGIVEDDASPNAVVWKSNIVDLGYGEQKTITWVEIASSNITSMTVKLHYRYNRSSAFTVTAGKEGTPDGRFFFGINGTEFKIEVLGTKAAGGEIERIDVKYNTFDNRSTGSRRGKPLYFG